MGRNPCLNCGACCSMFRVSFYWAETDEFTPGGVPSEMTVRINDVYLAMQGSERHPPRCQALAGVVGRKVFCGIYANRSSSCRNFTPSWQDGQANLRCSKARLAWGLEPLSTDSWLDPQGCPKAA